MYKQYLAQNECYINVNYLFTNPLGLTMLIRDEEQQSLPIFQEAV